MRRHVVGTIGNTIGTGGCDAREIGVGVGVEVGGDYKPATLSMSRGHAIELNSEQPRTPCTGAGAVHACGSLTILWLFYGCSGTIRIKTQTTISSGEAVYAAPRSTSGALSSGSCGLSCDCEKNTRAMHLSASRHLDAVSYSLS